MNENINLVCNELHNFAQSLKQEASERIRAIRPKIENMPQPARQLQAQSQVSNPERPWIVGGAVALGAGVIGAVASDSSWPYALGTLGLISIGYGLTKKNSQPLPANSQPAPSADTPKGFELAEKVIEVSKSVQNSWRNKVEECKTAVQHAIERSSAPETTKAEVMSLTYTTERISISFDTAVSGIESQPATAYSAILSEFERTVTAEIDKAANTQIAVYTNISNKL